MSQLLLDAFAAFLRSGTMLAIAAAVVWLALRAMRPKSALTHRTAWGCVLACGLLVFPYSLEIPWYDPPPADAAAHVADDLPDFHMLDHRPQHEPVGAAADGKEQVERQQAALSQHSRPHSIARSSAPGSPALPAAARLCGRRAGGRLGKFYGRRTSFHPAARVGPLSARRRVDVAGRAAGRDSTLVQPTRLVGRASVR